MINAKEARTIVTKLNEENEKKLNENISSFVESKFSSWIEVDAKNGKTQSILYFDRSDFETKFNLNSKSFKERITSIENIVNKIEIFIENYGFECDTYVFEEKNNYVQRITVKFIIKW